MPTTKDKPAMMNVTLDEASKKLKAEAKAKRKAEHMEKMKEAQERKRIKREENAAKQAKLRVEQLAEKEKRQQLIAHVSFDMSNLEKSVQKKLDPKGKQIQSVSYDFSKKAFVVKFTTPDACSKKVKGSTFGKPKTLKLSSSWTSTILPGPIESKCAYFLHPLEPNHPNVDRAEAWTKESIGENRTYAERMQAWVEAATEQFSGVGTIVNISKVRGFMVIQYEQEEAAKKFITQNIYESICGIPMLFIRPGTPTKGDKQACVKAFPMPKKTKKNKN